MTHGQSLAQTIEATQKSLEQRLHEAVAPHRHPDRPREAYADTDTFMAATSRHLAAVDAVLLPALGQCAPDGDTLVHDYLEVAKQLELTLASLKARLYGEAHAIYRSWPALWEEAQERLERHNQLETKLLDELLQHGDPDELDELAERLFHAETRAPTRPHPYTPHTGWVSRPYRRFWALADRFWDDAEGRMIPDPVRPAHHQHDSLVAQYLVADPQFDDSAALVGHRGGHRGRHRSDD